MIEDGIWRAAKDSTTIKFPPFGADLCNDWTLLEQADKRCVWYAFQFSITFSCLCDFILSAANLRADFPKRIIGEGDLVRDASFGYKLQCVVDITAFAVAAAGTWQEVLFWEVYRKGVIFFDDQFWLNISGNRKGPARAAAALVLDWGDCLALSPVQALGVSARRHP